MGCCLLHTWCGCCCCCPCSSLFLVSNSFVDIVDIVSSVIVGLVVVEDGVVVGLVVVAVVLGVGDDFDNLALHIETFENAAVVIDFEGRILVVVGWDVVVDVDIEFANLDVV